MAKEPVSLNEKLEYSGVWWLPEAPDAEFSGQLSFSPASGPVLNIQGAFGAGLPFPPPTILKVPLLLGFTTSGDEITLYNCHRASSRMHFPGMATSSWVANEAFIGVHFQTEDEMRFRRLSVRYSNLDEWVDRSGFAISHDDKSKGLKVAVQFQSPEPLKVTAGSYDFTFFIRSSYSSDNITQARITQQAWIGIESGQNNPLGDFLNVMYDLRNLLSIAMTAPTYPLEIEVETEASKRTDNGRESFNRVRILYRQSDMPTEIRPMNSFDMIFTLPKVEAKIGDYIANWLSNAELYRPAFDLYFSTLYGSHLYLEIRFLNLAQAVETYHRRKYGGKYQPDDDYRAGLYKNLVEAIPSEVDSDFRQSLKAGRLYYGNEFSLRKRLMDLTALLSTNLEIRFLASNKGRSRFVENVCDTRNYLTHYDPELESKAARGLELYRLTRRLQSLLEICFLQELGFSFGEISRVVSKHERYNSLSGQD